MSCNSCVIVHVLGICLAYMKPLQTNNACAVFGTCLASLNPLQMHNVSYYVMNLSHTLILYMLYAFHKFIVYNMFDLSIL